MLSFCHCFDHTVASLTSQSVSLTIGTGTIFRLGEQKLNDCSVGEAKIGEKQSRQSNSKYNFVQYVFFEKGIHSVWVWGIFENFCVKSNLAAYKDTFNCKLQKQDAALSLR